MTQDRVKELQNLKAKLNAAIDDLIDATEHQQDSNDAGLRLEKTSGTTYTSAKALVAATMPPTMTNCVWGLQPVMVTTVNIALDLNIFELLKGGLTTSTQIAQKTGAEEILIFRLLRALASFNFIHQTLTNKTHHNTLTPLGLNLTEPAMAGWMRIICHDGTFTALEQMPRLLKESNYANPISPQSNSTFHKVHGVAFFDYVRSQPNRLSDLDSAMRMQQLLSPNIMVVFSFHEYTEELSRAVSANPDTISIIDMGGGLGQALEDYRNAYPITSNTLPGRLILQDLQGTIAAADQKGILKSEGIETMVHDFFTPQPPSMHGAKFYHIRKCLHDWPDEEVRTVLKHVHTAMTGTPDFSRLLIVEAVLPDLNVDEYDAVMDINLMMKLCGIERSMLQWEGLLEECGFEIVRVVKARLGSNAIIEAKVART